MRLIDADKVIADNAKIIDCEIDHPQYQDTLREIIDSAETVDAVEVVRCKDCNKRGTSECYVENASGELAFPWIPPDDWFCADGEKKENGS